MVIRVYKGQETKRLCCLNTINNKTKRKNKTKSHWRQIHLVLPLCRTSVVEQRGTTDGTGGFWGFLSSPMTTWTQFQKAAQLTDTSYQSQRCNKTSSAPFSPFPGQCLLRDRPECSSEHGWDFISSPKQQSYCQALLGSHITDRTKKALLYPVPKMKYICIYIQRYIYTYIYVLFF